MFNKKFNPLFHINERAVHGGIRESVVHEAEDLESARGINEADLAESAVPPHPAGHVPFGRRGESTIGSRNDVRKEPKRGESPVSDPDEFKRREDDQPAGAETLMQTEDWKNVRSSSMKHSKNKGMEKSEAGFSGRSGKKGSDGPRREEMDSMKRVPNIGGNIIGGPATESNGDAKEDSLTTREKEDPDDLD